MNLSKFFFTGIFLVAVCLLTNCQPAARYASNSSYKSGENYAENDSKAQKNSEKKQKSSANYDVPAKIIYPKSKTNKHSNKIIVAAEKWLGVPYLYGGNTRKGIDCSGFVKNVYKEIGINLPRTSAQQFAFAIPVKNPQVGDLVFFKKGNRIDHVGIYIGNDKIIHASSSKKGVTIQAMKNTSLEKMFAGYGKVV
jgi:cell wall-associated NlpC family hydrolase